VDSYDLIDSLVRDIKHLESKIVYLRHALSKHLAVYEGERLMCDIFSDLSAPYWDNPLYQQYMEKYHDGINPLDNGDLSKYLRKVKHGKAQSNL
jgi:hypothetical protein